MNLFIITPFLIIIGCTSVIESVREVYVLKNNFWNDNDKIPDINFKMFAFITIELLECTEITIKNNFFLNDCYYDEQHDKYYLPLCCTDVNLNLLTENRPNEKQKMIKFRYRYSGHNNGEYSDAWYERNCRLYNYKVFKKAANNSIKFESNRTDVYLYQIKRLLSKLFDKRYLTLKKINLIKKKKINAKSTDFKLLHFKSLLECQRSLKRFARFFNFLKMVGEYPNFSKNDSSSEDDIDSNKKDVSENEEDGSFDNSSENSLSDTSTENSQLYKDYKFFCEMKKPENYFNLSYDECYESNSTDENCFCDNHVIIIDNEPWRKKVLFNIEEESSIDIDSSSDEEYYKIESPNRRLKLIFVEKYLKEKFDKDYKEKKKGDVISRLLYKQIKVLFKDCCDKISFSLLFDRIILPIKGIYTIKFYLDKFYDFIQQSIDILIEDFDNDKCKSEFKRKYKHVSFFWEQIAALYASIRKNAWDQFNVTEHFTKVIGKDIIKIEDYVEIESMLCDYYNMMSTSLRNKFDVYYENDPTFLIPLFIDNYECRILKMLEVSFKDYIKIREINCYDLSNEKFLLEKNKDYFFMVSNKRGVLLNIEIIREKNIHEIEIVSDSVNKTYRFSIHEHLNNTS